MGANSQLFLQMRAEDEARIFAQSVTKKDAISLGKSLVSNILETGEDNPIEVAAKLARLNEVVNAALSEIKDRLPQENITAFGVQFSHVNGGNTLNYSEDPIYNALKADLDSRTELLKLAQKQTVFDAYGNEVPKVGNTPKKSYMTVKF